MNFAAKLLNWYDLNGRSELPWRNNIDFYRVWVSEIMLQQTQVTTVIPYFLRFINRFPDISALASAAIDEVLQYWSGLGYYARGRNLHKTAILVVNEYQGQFPTQYEQIIKLPGIGRSTAGAILAIAFKKPYAILDGNVRRILARYFLVKGWKNQEILWNYSQSLLPKKRIDDFTQALMDLGAMVCTVKKPLCLTCPINTECKAFQTQAVEDYPEKKPPKVIPKKNAFVFIVENENGEILLERRPPYGIWGGLWSLPEWYCSTKQKKKVHCYIEEHYFFKTLWLGEKYSIQHTFSHYHVNLHPIKLKIIENLDVVSQNVQRKWYSLESALALGLPAPIRRILETENPI